MVKTDARMSRGAFVLGKAAKRCENEFSETQTEESTSSGKDKTNAAEEYHREYM